MFHPVFERKKACYTIYQKWFEKDFFVLISNPDFVKQTIKLLAILFYEQIIYQFIISFEETYEAKINTTNFNQFSTAKKRSNGVFM